MIIHDNVQQGTPVWHELRRGELTASRASVILTEPRANKDKEAGLLSAGAISLMLELLGERMTGRANIIPPTRAMEWGKLCEPIARRIYREIATDEVKEVAFVSHDTLRCGCSPDGLVGDIGGLEIKCPYTDREHMRNWLLATQATPTILPDHIPQVQFSMWITERERWDSVSYCPWLERTEHGYCKVRTDRDDDYIAKMERAAKRFCERLDEAEERMRAAAPIDSEVHRAAHNELQPVELKIAGQTILV